MTARMESAHCTHPLWRDRDIPTQRAVCAGCPVSAQCLSRALETIRALTPSERSEVRADRKPDVWAGRTIRELIDAGEWQRLPKRNRGRRAPGKVYNSPVRYCPRGHDTHEVGRYANYRCTQCQREDVTAQRKAAA